MDNIFQDKRLSRIDNQLDLLNQKKKIILRDLYRSYEIYLSEIRSQLFNDVSKGLSSLAGINQIRGRIDENNLYSLLNNEIKLIIDKVLPFITIEQLSILDEIFDEANQNKITKFNKYQFIEEIDLTSRCFTEELNLQNDYYYYYGFRSKSNFKNSVDLDNIYEENNFMNIETTLIESYEEKEFYIPESEKNENQINLQNKSQTFNIFEKNELESILDWSHSIDIGLTFQLKKISVEANNKFFGNILNKEFISENLISYLFENSFLTTNPKPFITKIDLLSNDYIYSDDVLNNINFSKIYLFCINPTELEFNNINLNIQRNQILNLKNLLKSLIKKEHYWSSKKLHSNYYLNKIYKS